MKLNSRNKRSAVFALRLALILTSATLLPLLLYGSTPSWWSQRGVLVTGANADDYASANQGQLKNIAKAAAAEMDAKLPGGAGQAVHDLVGGWSNPATQPNDFAPVNLGQLKNVAKLFYDRLIAAGIAVRYPWSAASHPPDDFAIANIGQVKALFSFELPAVDPLYDGDHNGLPDTWERQYFGTTGVDPGADADGDGVNNLQEYLHHTDPTDYFNGTLKSLSVTGGGDQRGAPGSLLPVPVSIRVSTVDSDGVMNASVTVMIAQGGARVRTATGVPATELTVRATAFDNDGYPVAQVYVLLPPTPDVSVIRASSSGGVRSVSVITTAVAIDASLVAPSNLVVTPTSGSSARLTWNPASNTSATTVQVSVDGGRTWITLGTVAPGVREATVTGLKPDQTVSFRLFSGGTPSANSSSFAFPDPLSGPPPAPPPGPGGGAATQPVDAVPLGAPVMEIETQSVARGKFGFRGLFNQSGPYRDKTLVITSNYTNSDGTPDPSTGTTTVRQHWQRINNGDTASQVNTTEVTGGGGFLNPPLTTVTNTDTVFRQEGAPLPGYSGGSSRTITLSDLYTDEQLNAEGAALVPSFNDDFWPAEDDAYADLRKTSLVYEVTFLQYRFKVNADPNLVVTWDVQFTPDDGGPVQHDIQSWAPQGSVQSPTYLLDPRTLNGGKTGTYLVTLLSVELMVDGNRDGQMSFDDSSIHDKDGTTAEKPYRFWLNNDADGILDGEEVEGGSPDYADTYLKSLRDLEDFTRLWITFKGITEMVKTGGVTLQLEWKPMDGGTNWPGDAGNPAINVFKAVETDGGNRYLSDEATAKSQVSYGDTPTEYSISLGRVGRGQPLTLPASFFATLSESQPNKFLLFEGAGEGRGQFVLTLHKNGEKIGEYPPIYLQLSDVKKMYVRGYSAAQDSRLPYEFTEQPVDPNISLGTDPNSSQLFQQPRDETPQCVLFIHGFNQTYEASTSYAETMFKRLWWRGFAGRFASFRWPTFGEGGNLGAVGTYNNSEYMAWNSSVALRQFVGTLPQGYAINVAAHSMGNMVVGQALRGGLRVSHYAMLHSATSASCYSNPNFAYSVTNTQKPTPDTDTDLRVSSLAYTGWLGAIDTDVTNFGDNQDSAVGFAWNYNNDHFRPESSAGAFYSYDYYYDPSLRFDLRLGVTFHDRDVAARTVTSSPETKAYIDCSMTGAIGYNETQGGAVTSYVDDNYLGDDHGAEWGSDIRRTGRFYHDLLTSFGLIAR